MNATGTRAWSLTAALSLLALAGSAAPAGAREVEQRAKVAGAESRPAGEKLEKSAQGFGESIWDGMKSVGRSLQKFFTGS